jgi:hypothetical protein
VEIRGEREHASLLSHHEPGRVRSGRGQVRLFIIKKKMRRDKFYFNFFPQS